jgi:erythrin-vacuolar iron transport family protein
LPSHRYSTPRYRPSAHALDTHTSGVHALVSDRAAGGATATMTPLRVQVATPSPALPVSTGFADTLLGHIEARTMLDPASRSSETMLDPASRSSETMLDPASRSSDERAFVLRYVQPGLVGLIDGTLSTLAPIFAVALLSTSHAALLVGLATALGAGISMGLSEALSDDGGQTGRGSAITRGSITGVMTTVGGVFHALPFLIPDRTIALVFAAIVVAVELGLIAAIRKRYLDVSLRSSLIQVVFGGILIVGVGLWLGGL